MSHGNLHTNVVKSNLFVFEMYFKKEMYFVTVHPWTDNFASLCQTRLKMVISLQLQSPFLLQLPLFPQTTFESRLAASPPLRLTRSSAATSTEAVECVDHRAKIRPICLNVFCVHPLICLFVWRRLLSRCACPTLVSPLCSSCSSSTTSNGMAYSIRYGLS